MTTRAYSISELIEQLLIVNFESDGTLSVNTASYETLVTADNDIPNKKYVDDALAGFSILDAYTQESPVNTPPTATGTDALAMGDGGTIASGANSIAIGTNAHSYEADNIAIGDNAQGGQTSGGATEQFTIAIGYSSKAYESGGVAIGYLSESGTSGTSTAPYSIAVGYSAKAKLTTSTSVGPFANAVGANCTALGGGASAGQTGGVNAQFAAAVGHNALAYGQASVSMGYSAQTGISGATYGYQVAIGDTSHAYSIGSIAIGSFSQAGSTVALTEYYAISMGREAKAYEEGCISIGFQSVAGVADASADPFGISIGNLAQATGANSVSIGQSVQNANDDEVHIGSSNTNKMILDSTGQILSNNTFKSNVGAVVDPTTTDDSSTGYTVGSRWYNTTADSEWVCLDNTASAAVWTETTGGGGATLVDDTSTNGEFYPTFTNLTSGIMTDASVSSTKLTYNPSTGAFTAVDFVSTSDQRLKENIGPIEQPIDIIKQIEGHSFTWKETGKHSYGFIAQELETVLPDVVFTNAEGMKSVNYIATIGILLEAVKQLNKRVEELESK